MAAQTDRALVLRRFRYGESSLVLQVLTEGRGRVHLIARGAYRPGSRYYAVLDLFDTLELTWSHQPGRELQNLREGTLIDRRMGIVRDLGLKKLSTQLGGFYRKLAVYGHMGRTDLDVPWENTAIASKLK